MTATLNASWSNHGEAVTVGTSCCGQLDPLTLAQDPSPASWRALNALTHRPSVASEHTELSGHLSDRPPGVGHQLHGLVLELRSELPTLSSHDEHPLLRGVHRTGSRPPRPPR